MYHNTILPLDCRSRSARLAFYYNEPITDGPTRQCDPYEIRANAE